MASMETEDVQRLTEDAEESDLPESVLAAKEAVPGDAAMELDATEWLLESDGPTDEEVEPQEIRLNVGAANAPKWIIWKVVPLPDSEFKKFRRMAMGNRNNRRRLAQGDPSAMDDSLYTRLVVAAATVYPDLQAQAAAKGVDVLDLLTHRFAAKPLLLSQISGIISDISGGDEADAELVAGN